MSNPAIVEEITRAAGELDVPQHQRVLAYIRAIKDRPPGKSPENLLRMAGTIPVSDCQEMETAIHEGCGQVNFSQLASERCA